MSMQARYDAKNPPALRRLLDAGVDMRPFTDDVLSAAATASRELLEEQAAADATYRGVYERWQRFRIDSYRWFATAELAYARFAFPRL